MFSLLVIKIFADSALRHDLTRHSAYRCSVSPSQHQNSEALWSSGLHSGTCLTKVFHGMQFGKCALPFSDKLDQRFPKHQESPFISLRFRADRKKLCYLCKVTTLFAASVGLCFSAQHNTRHAGMPSLVLPGVLCLLV